MSTTNLTIGDVLPEYMKASYSETVLNVPLSEAVEIAVYDEPPTSDLSEEDINSIDEIFEKYQSEGGPGGSDAGGSAYWSKSPEEVSYWNKQ